MSRRIYKEIVGLKVIPALLILGTRHHYITLNFVCVLTDFPGFHQIEQLCVELSLSCFSWIRFKQRTLPRSI